MTRSSFTRILLGGALAAACSKPNPLFLDTWDAVTDSSSNSEGSAAAATLEPTTLDPTTDLPPTTGTSTTTSSSDTGTSSPVSTTSTDPSETTGESFFCELVGGCCEVWLPIEVDTFFVDAGDGVGPGCPLVANLPPEYSNIPCGLWNFGAVHSLSLFTDELGDNQFNIKGDGMMALNFPLNGGQLQIEGEPVAWDLVDSLALELDVELDWGVYTGPTFALHGLPATTEWFEGEGMPTPCSFGGSSKFCVECMGDVVPACKLEWEVPEAFPVLEEVEAAKIAETRLELPLDKMKLVEAAASGLVLRPTGATINNQYKAGLVPYGALVARTAESNTPPRLRARLCPG